MLPTFHSFYLNDLVYVSVVTTPPISQVVTFAFSSTAGQYYTLPYLNDHAILGRLN